MRLSIVILLVVITQTFAISGRYSVPGIPTAPALCECEDGYVIYGGCYASGVYDVAPAAVRISATGDSLWSFNLPQIDDFDYKFLDVIELADGGILFYVGDYSLDTTWLIKKSPYGDSLWTISLPDTLIPHGLVPTSDSGFTSFQPVCCGAWFHGRNGFQLIHFDKYGSFAWAGLKYPFANDTTYASCNSLDKFDLIQTESGDYVAVGAYTSMSMNHNIELMRFSSDGDTLRKCYRGFGDYVTPEYIAESVDGNIAVVGSYNASGPYPENRAFIYVTDSLLTNLYTKTFWHGSTHHEGFEFVVATPDNEWLVGYSHYYTGGENYNYLWLDEYGLEVFSMPYPETLDVSDMLYDEDLKFVECGKCDGDFYIRSFNGRPEIELLSPVGGERWFAEEIQTILWYSRDIDSVKISYSTNSGTSWEIESEAIESDGFYEWNLPDVYSENCLVHIGWVKDSSVSSQTDPVFTIDTASVGGESITLIAPDEDTLFIGYNYEIMWNTVRVDSIELDYSTDDGAVWEEIASSLVADSSVFVWNIPATRCNLGLLRLLSSSDSSVVAYSPSNFVIAYSGPWIEIVQPSAGTIWEIGDSVQVVWNYGNIETGFFIHFSEDAGDEWLLIDGVDEDDSVYNWIVPDCASDSCMIAVCTYDSFTIDTLARRMRPMDEDEDIYGITGIFSIVDSGDYISERIPYSSSISFYPNPFNSSCRISAPKNAIIEIFDINGRSIAEFDGGDQIWKPEASVGSGVYLVRAKIGDNNITKRVVYLK